MLFQGEEWNASTPFLYFTDHSEGELAEAVRNGRRREFSGFGWKPEDIPDPQDELTFTRSKLDWVEPEKPEGKDMLQWYRNLAAFRRSTPALLEGRNQMRVTFDEQARWLVLQRRAVLLVCNFGLNPVAVPIPESDGEAVLRLGSQPGIIAERGLFRLPPESAAVFELMPPNL
jgi:maltooligosyltrehalose trehalohydrolase